MATPQHKNSCPGDHEIYTLPCIDSSMVIITIHFVCLRYANDLPLGLGEVVIKYLDKIDQVVLVSWVTQIT